MIQRLLYTALKEGLAQFMDPQNQFYDQLFSDLMGLEPREIEGIKQQLRDNPPAVVHVQSEKNTRVPTYAIGLNSEQQIGYYLGNNAGMGAQKPVFSTMWQHNYIIYCYSQHIDVTQYIYEIAKAILFIRAPELERLNLLKISMNGSDVQPDPQFAPDFLFLRTLEFHCQREFRFSSPGNEGRLFSVEGLSVPGGSPNADASFSAEVSGGAAFAGIL